uniref:Threonylcarbamoyl-AMP synthase n=1 Tax=Pogona vitticeps TaxID=103695 RepID=A0ABM5EVP1_9SAUR
MAAAAPAARGGQSLHQSVGLLSIAAGSLLLAVHFYSFTRPTPLLSRTALGVLLLILSPFLAYAGVRKTFQEATLFVSLCLTLSVLWCGYGAIQILAGQGILLHADADLRDAAVPGLGALSLSLFLLGLVGLLQREVPLAVVALATSLACAHETAALYDRAFGFAAVACSHLVVCFAGGYVGLGRILFFLSQEAILLPGTGLAPGEAGKGPSPARGAGTHDLTPLSLTLNMLSASVWACQLLGVTGGLSVGQVPWLWAGGIYQLGVSVFSYRSLDVRAATFSGFTALLKLAGGYCLLVLFWAPELPAVPVPLSVTLAILLAIVALFVALDSLADGLYVLFYVAFCIALACRPRGLFEGGPQGVAVAIFVASAPMTFIHLYNRNGSVKIPRGEGVLGALLSRLSLCKLWEGKAPQEPYLGYSKYADAEALGYACSVLASFAISVGAEPVALLARVVLPWVVAAGGILKFLCGFVAFSRGKTLESSVFILYGSTWVIWGLTRYGGLYGSTRGFQVAVGIASLMLSNAFMALCALFLSASWFAYTLTFELILISFLLDAVGATPRGYDVAVTIIFGLVSFYCFLSSLVNGTFERPQLPAGRSLVRLSGSGGGRARCPHLPARKASSVKQVADIMKRGGACGIPTDTVYVLAAACSRPDAVEKAYNTKRQAQDRPMSLWISSLKQLEPAKHLFSPILWDFMDAAWPSPISLVVPRGEWVDCLGMKDSAKYVGTPQSIAVRIPDCSVATHLIDLVGPITVTSANPTGEADTTHHNQVYAKLGDKVDAVLCDGPSPENIASTVVDCTKIETGSVGFFRVGIVPKSQVLQILEEVQRKHQPGQARNIMAAGGTGKPQALGAAGSPLKGDPLPSYSNEGFQAEEASEPSH